MADFTPPYVTSPPTLTPAPLPQPESVLPSELPTSGLDPDLNLPVPLPQQSGKHRSGLREALSTIGAVAAALVLAVMLIAFVFRSYEVSGHSMESTLQDHDKLIVWKVPRTWADITHHQYVPERGNIIIFKQADLSACGQDMGQQLVKRVIGLPGDHVIVSNDVYTIYNKQHPHGFDPDKTLSYFKGRTVPATTGNVNLTLSAHQIFVSGDNRPGSCDSRRFGPVDTSQIVGQVVLRVLPAKGLKAF